LEDVPRLELVGNATLAENEEDAEQGG